MMVHWSQKPVSMARDGFDVSRTLRRISEREAQLGHRFVEAAIKINEGMSGPEVLPQLFSRHHFTGMFQKEAENLEGLFLQLDSNAALAKLSRPDIQLENTEDASSPATLCRLHG
jgi:hypothetical protein